MGLLNSVAMGMASRVRQRRHCVYCHGLASHCKTEHPFPQLLRRMLWVPFYPVSLCDRC